jgi:hypothetical protein
VVPYAIFYICIMVCYAGAIPLFINIGKSVYGEENSSFVFACLESCEGVGTIFEAILIYFLADYVLYVYIIFTVTAILGLVLS